MLVAHTRLLEISCCGSYVVISVLDDMLPLKIHSTHNRRDISQNVDDTVQNVLVMLPFNIHSIYNTVKISSNVDDMPPFNKHSTQNTSDIVQNEYDMQPFNV